MRVEFGYPVIDCRDHVVDLYRWTVITAASIVGSNAIRTGDEDDRFCHGDKVTMADICLVPQVINARNFDLDMTPFPTLQRISDAALALPEFERAMPSNQKDFE
jgi:hypothetical protein